MQTRPTHLASTMNDGQGVDHGGRDQSDGWQRDASTGSQDDPAPSDNEEGTLRSQGRTYILPNPPEVQPRARGTSRTLPHGSPPSPMQRHSDETNSLYAHPILRRIPTVRNEPLHSAGYTRAELEVRQDATQAEPQGPVRETEVVE